MTTREADTLVIGAGIAGVMVAQELLEAGQSVAIVERGGLVPWNAQLEKFEEMLPEPDHRVWENDSPTAAHNHEIDPEGMYWDWDYLYGVGGTTNHWTGTTPMLLPEDFEMKSRYGVMRDWPISYEDLLPHYNRAMKLMAISGEKNALMPGARFPLPAHEFSPQDDALKDHLDPFIAVPQARPSKSVGGVSACCHSARCSLCPMNARFSVLNRLGWVFDRAELIPDTIATRLVSDAGSKRIEAVECIDRDGTRSTIRAKRFVIAANTIESAGLMLRSGLDHGDTAVNLFDHRESEVLFRTGKSIGPGYGHSVVTGVSYRYYSGKFRGDRAAVLLLPANQGIWHHEMRDQLVEGLVSGREGSTLRAEIEEQWSRSVRLAVYIDDVPDRGNRVSLSAKRDRFGIPLNRVKFNGPSDYWKKGFGHVIDDVPKQLQSLRVSDFKSNTGTTGAHILGTLRMGTDQDAVVDAQQRHHRRENLWVAGGAVMPTYSPAHPTLTIAALSVRLGRHLAGAGA